MPRATMRVAPGDPEKPGGFKSRFLCQVLHQAGGPFTSSVVQHRKTWKGVSWYSC